MAYKITAHSITGPTIDTPLTPSETKLRQTFESAVCEIYRADRAAEKQLEYRAPIVSRRKILGLSQEGAEKRALSDAARALAQLWKV